MTRPLPLPFVLATQNVDKAREITEIIVDETDAPLAAYAVTIDDETIGFLLAEPEQMPAAVDELVVPAAAPDVTETGATLEENARIKASAVADALNIAAVADDTGLEVDALGGEPGVYSARYAGEGATYADNVTKLLHELGDADGRTARFATVAIACWPGGREVSVRGEVEGKIAKEARGDQGFGYDPVFVPDEGDGSTFAEMTPDEKHAVSHRGRAFRALVTALTQED
jgi:XTP/dITP diphosphohydrolase